MPLPRSSEVKVGCFAMVVLLVFLAVVMVLTSQSSFFRRSILLHTSFNNIAGVISGAEVRLSGVTIGYVNSVNFSPKPGDTTVLVDLTVDNRGMDRVMKDSRATIASLGLLGKKYIEIMPGTAAAGKVKDGDFIKGVEPASLSEALDKGGKVLESMGEISEHLKTLFGSVAGEEGQATDLSRTITSIKNIVGEVETGDGVLHSLIYDPTKTKIVTDLAASVNHIRAFVAQVETGPGNLHEVIYGAQFKDLIANLTATSEGLKQAISDIKTEKGLMHELIYDPDKAKLLEDLKETAANIADITERLERGEGTIGGFLIDPTIYEDVKKLTGEVERNKVLKTYIRYVVRKREADLEKSQRPPETAPPPETTPEPSPDHE